MRRSLVLVALSLLVVTSCRAFSSSYKYPEGDLAAQRVVAAPSTSKPAPGSGPAESAPVVDYSKDKSVCKTPEGVKVGKNNGSLMAAAGWAFPADREKVTITATQLGAFTTRIQIQKELGTEKSELSFTVKQTAADAYSACDFDYNNDKSATVSGVVAVDRLNTLDEKAKKVYNSGSFDLRFTGGSATSTQKIILGASSPTVSADLSGVYFVDAVAEAAE